MAGCEESHLTWCIDFINIIDTLLINLYKISIIITEGAPEIDPVLEVASSVIQNIDDVPILILSDEQFTQEGLVNSVQISINLEDLENIVDFSNIISGLYNKIL